MGIGDWKRQTVFDWRRIEDNITKVRPETIEWIRTQETKPCQIGL